MGKDTRDLYKVVTSASKDNQFQDVNNTEQKSSQSRLAKLMIAYSEQYTSIRLMSSNVISLLKKPSGLNLGPSAHIFALPTKDTLNFVSRSLYGAQF